MGGNFWANFGSVFLTNWTQGFLLSVAGGAGLAAPGIAASAREYGPKISFWLEKGVNILLNSVLPTTGDLTPVCGLNCNSMKVPK